MLYQIKSRFTGKVIFEKDADSLKLCVEAAVSSGADLRGAYLGGANLRDADLYGADLRGANLGGADLRDADLGGANLRDADLYGADLRGANLGGADLRGVYLRGADLYGATIGENAPCTRPPIVIGGLMWPVTIADTHMRIGCELHSFEDWEGFKTRRIAEMARQAPKFWKQWKAPLLAMCRAHEANKAIDNTED